MMIKSPAALIVALALAMGGFAPVKAEPAPSLRQTEAPFEAATVRADLADLYSTLQTVHYDLYARTSKATYEDAFADMTAGLTGPMTRAEVVALFQRFMAVGRVAHANIDEAGAAYAAYRQGGGRAFPLAVRVIDDRFYVAGNNSGLDTIALGDEILTLNGEPVSQWLAHASAQVSADTPYMLGAMMESRFGQVVWGRLGEQSTFEMHLARQGQTPFDVVVPARTRPEMIAASQAQPATLDLSWTAREAHMLDDGIAYLRPGPTYNVEGDEASMYDNRAFRVFMDQAFETFIAAHATDLIIDLRDNPGGDNSFSDLMMAWIAKRPFRFNAQFRIKVSAQTVASNQARLAVVGNDPTGVSAELAAAYQGVAPGTVIDFPVPETRPRDASRFDGRVYALINRHSYSNTVAMAATIQDYGFGVILGEETSDLATTIGAMEHFTLSRTGIVVSYPKALIVRPNGNTDPKGVTPDIAIPTPIVEGLDDPVLHQTIDLIMGRKRPAS